MALAGMVARFRFMKNKVIIGGVVLVVAVLVVVGLVMQSPPSVQVLISLKELPGVTQEVLAAQGSLFRVGEPFVYNRETKMAVFVVEILSAQNFGGATHVRFGGDARSLGSFVNEVRMVNSGPSRLGSAGSGMADGVESLASGVWQLLRHPIDTVVGLGNAAVDLAVYVKDTSLAEVQTDVSNLVDAFYVNRACEVAESHSVDYFELKTDAGKAAVHSETNYRLGGQAGIELATFLVPFSKLKYAGEAGEAANAAAKGAEAARAAEVAAEASEWSPEAGKFAKAGRLFPKMSEKMGDTLGRLKYAEKPSQVTRPVATVGRAASTDYATTFFTKHPHLEGKVVVHHAVEQQVLERYPGVFTPEEIHSLENLRGIPKGLDADLHKSCIRKEWNEFYRANPANTMTKQKVLDKAAEIDEKYGHLFEPKVV